MNTSPVSSPIPTADQILIARMMVEVVQADQRIDEAEVSWLDEHLPVSAGTALALAALPPLEPRDLAAIHPDWKLKALLWAWNVALVDEELAPEEERLLQHFAAGLGLSADEAERAARNRRIVLPLQRLGLQPNENPALFRFLDMCSEIPGISKIDHCTFVTHHEDTDAFLDHWRSHGFADHGEWFTEDYPARHIALIRGRPAGFPWEEMIGLTVSDDPSNPMRRTLPDRDHTACTHHLQHIAINVQASADMQEILDILHAKGVQFMTSVLSYDDDLGAGLRQMFTASMGGFFIEFAQRIPNAAGEPFGGFHIGIIDDLYRALDGAEASWNALSSEARERHAHWLPERVHFALETAG